MTRKSNRKKRRSGRRSYRDELKAEAVQMLLDGHRADSVASNLGLSGANLLYPWKAKLIKDSGPAATTLENRVRQLEEELRRVERERDIVKKALAIFSQRMETKSTWSSTNWKRKTFPCPGCAKHETWAAPPSTPGGEMNSARDSAQTTV